MEVTPDCSNSLDRIPWEISSAHFEFWNRNYVDIVPMVSDTLYSTTPFANLEKVDDYTNTLLYFSAQENNRIF